jgi:hypothetical protein
VEHLLIEKKNLKQRWQGIRIGKKQVGKRGKLNVALDEAYK